MKITFKVELSTSREVRVGTPIIYPNLYAVHQNISLEFLWL